MKRSGSLQRHVPLQRSAKPMARSKLKPVSPQQIRAIHLECEKYTAELETLSTRLKEVERERDELRIVYNMNAKGIEEGQRLMQSAPGWAGPVVDGLVGELTKARETNTQLRLALTATRLQIDPYLGVCDERDRLSAELDSLRAAYVQLQAVSVQNATERLEALAVVEPFAKAADNTYTNQTKDGEVTNDLWTLGQYRRAAKALAFPSSLALLEFAEKAFREGAEAMETEMLRARRQEAPVNSISGLWFNAAARRSLTRAIGEAK